MQQRLSIRAIITDDTKVLLLKRSTGRDSILGKYELPGGKLAYGEQPEDALRRYLHDDAGLHLQSAKLYDAVTYIDHDDREIQYGVLVYMVTLAPQQHAIKLSKNYNKYRWYTKSNIQQDELTDLTQLLLGIITQKELTDITLLKTQQIDDNNATVSDASGKVILYSDGGSRGNPGPSAAGFVIQNTAGHTLDEGGEYLGIATNNLAEYHGVRLALERAVALNYRNVECRVDSMLVVNQMKGLYKIKNRELWPVHERIRILMQQFDRVVFTHVTRDRNQLADGVVNKILNKQKDEDAKSSKAVA